MPANPPPSFPEYPFDEFVRDFGAVDRGLEAAREIDPAGAVRLAGAVARGAYSDAAEARRRGAALAMARAFLENHLEDRRFRRHVRVGVAGMLYSEGLFEAVYRLVVGFALDPRRERPDPASVLRLADERERVRRPAESAPFRVRLRRGLERLLRP